MADYIVRRSQLGGTIAIPASKSHSIRAVLFGAIAKGQSMIDDLLDSPDVDAAIRVSCQLGALVERSGNRCQIQGVHGKMTALTDVVDVGNSGIVLRFVGALAALMDSYTILTGDASIRSQRSVQALIDGLHGLGAFADSSRRNGLPPLIVKGPMKAGVTHLNGADSQPVSALLMAAAWLPGRTEVVVESPGELPWLELTLSWLKRLGVPCQHENFNRFLVDGGNGWSGFQYRVPGDLSTAAFPLVAALITQSEITLSNVDFTDVQGDKKIVDVLRQMGAHIEVDEAVKQVRVLGAGTPLQGIAIDMDEMIDALPILAVVGCFAEGETRLFNAANARHKESDRIAGIARELRRMGGQVTETPDGLVIRPAHLHGAEVHCYGDHRLAMALAVAGLTASGTTHIKDIDCVNKTYRSFADHMVLLGAHIQRVNARGES